jgi:chromosome segregation ATPase
MNTTSGDVRTRAALPPEVDRLELTVRRLMDEHERWRRRAQKAERRVAELESALKDVTAGDLDPVALVAQMESAERDNRVLRERLEQARDTVERITARLHFLEEER